MLKISHRKNLFVNPFVLLAFLIFFLSSNQEPDSI